MLSVADDCDTEKARDVRALTADKYTNMDGGGRAELELWVKVDSCVACKIVVASGENTSAK